MALGLRSLNETGDSFEDVDVVVDSNASTREIFGVVVPHNPSGAFTTHCPATTSAGKRHPSLKIGQTIKALGWPSVLNEHSVICPILLRANETLDTRPAGMVVSCMTDVSAGEWLEPGQSSASTSLNFV